MTTTSASIGYGAVFALHNGTTYQSLGEVTNITPPNISVDAVDATHMESTGGVREFIAGLQDNGEVKIEMNYVPNSATDALILSLLRASVLAQITVVGGGSSPSEIFQFGGIITGYEREAPLDDKMTAALTVKVSGPVTVN